jgi:hypothetical protein
MFWVICFLGGFIFAMFNVTSASALSPTPCFLCKGWAQLVSWRVIFSEALPYTFREEINVALVQKRKQNDDNMRPDFCSPQYLVSQCLDL